ncbi:MAG: hypothetical protein ACLP52_33115, partial [Streptosporangiaceae bacterium]
MSVNTEAKTRARAAGAAARQAAGARPAARGRGARQADGAPGRDGPGQAGQAAPPAGQAARDVPSA